MYWGVSQSCSLRQHISQYGATIPIHLLDWFDAWGALKHTGGLKRGSKLLSVETSGSALFVSAGNLHGLQGSWPGLLLFVGSL